QCQLAGRDAPAGRGWVRRLPGHRVEPRPPAVARCSAGNLAANRRLDGAGAGEGLIPPPYNRVGLCRRLVREPPMPKLSVEGVGEFEIPAGKRLVLALEDEAKVDQLHACGGNARCTTCRVEFVSGEPDKMTKAEKDVLAARGVTGVRLSCQIACDHESAGR